MKLGHTVKITFWAFFIIVFTSSVSIARSTTDLVTLYHLAKLHDLQYKADIAKYLKIRQSLPQAVAGLLPDLRATGEWSHIGALRNSNAAGTLLARRGQSYNYSVTLTQTLINFEKIHGVSEASMGVKQALNELHSAELRLMMRVVQAYLQVLESKASLKFTNAEKAATGLQIEKARERYAVKFTTATTIYEAQSAYDAVRARAIDAANSVQNRIEDLKIITGQRHKNIRQATFGVPLIRPVPNNVNYWEKMAKTNNYALKAARYARKSIKQKIKRNYARHAPDLAAFLRFDDTQSFSRTVGLNNQANAVVGLRLNVPILQGGAIAADTNQAAYEYQERYMTEGNLEREVVTDARKAFNNIISRIKLVKARKRSVASARNSLTSSERALSIGTRTIIDYLITQRELFRAQFLHAQAEYQYALEFLRIKQIAGNLTVNDLEQVSKWFTKSYKR